MKNFLANILVIWDGRCDFFGSLSVSGRKKGGVKKKSGENSSVFLFFLKNDQILTNTKTFKICVFFHQFRPIYAFLKFKKPGIFSIFWQIWQLFFQNAILSKIGPRTIKNGFSEIVYVLKMVYINF